MKQHYSDMEISPSGFVQTPFTAIKKGDVFFEEGRESMLRATSSVQLSPTGGAYMLTAEDIDFETVIIGHAKNAMAYIPKYFVSQETPQVK